MNGCSSDNEMAHYKQYHLEINRGWATALHLNLKKFSVFKHQTDPFSSQVAVHHRIISDSFCVFATTASAGKKVTPGTPTVEKLTPTSEKTSSSPPPSTSLQTSHSSAETQPSPSSQTATTNQTTDHSVSHLPTLPTASGTPNTTTQNTTHPGL